MSASTLFPHQKLDWTLRRLESAVEKRQDDAATRLELARLCLSRGWWHEGGEAYFNKALTHARRLLQGDGANVTALVIAGMSLLGLERLDPATRHLDEAVRLGPERPDVRFALGILHERQVDRHGALRELEMACRLAPDSWEAHQALGRVLWARAREIPARGRLVERSQFHTVRALSLDPATAQIGTLIYHLAMLCVQEGRHNEAHNLFVKLQDYDAWKGKARHWLGIVAYQAGKYKNAVLYLRQHLDHQPDDYVVLGRLAMCYLQLGELSKAREACNRALAVEPDDLQARFTLACTLLEDNLTDEASKLLKDVLANAPGHVPAFTEVVRLRARTRDAAWLRRALRAEVATYDKLPPGARVLSAEGPVDAWRSIRQRVSIVVKALSDADGEAAQAIVGAMDLTTDEGLRFLLWEGALAHLSSVRAASTNAMLEAAGTRYSAGLGREILALSDLIPESSLIAGLQVSEDDLKRQAVDRHGPARDVTSHRNAIDAERQEARAWQSMLLLALGARRTRSGRNLLVRWAAEADPDLSYAASAALVVHGDPDATAALRKQARPRRAERWLDSLVSLSADNVGRVAPRPVSGAADRVCATCGRRGDEVSHLLLTDDTCVCDGCLTDVARNRRELSTPDAHVACSLCGNTKLQARSVYVYRNVAVCAVCVDASLGLTEREEIDRFLAAQ